MIPTPAPYTVGLCVAIMALLAIAVYLVDRGLANTTEAIAIWLLRFSARLRKRRSDVECGQLRELREVTR